MDLGDICFGIVGLILVIGIFAGIIWYVRWSIKKTKETLAKKAAQILDAVEGQRKKK
jgi:hypothetical protein